MTLSLFTTLLAILSTVSSLITEALKKTFTIEKPTWVVAIVSAIVGWGGCAIVYLIKAIPYTTPNILCLLLTAPACWLVATLGYDKVMEVIKQFGKI